MTLVRIPVKAAKLETGFCCGPADFFPYRALAEIR